jgi:hypothetical protein
MPHTGCLFQQGPGTWRLAHERQFPAWLYRNAYDRLAGPCAADARTPNLYFHSQHCLLHPLDARAFCERLDGRQVHFVGDSVHSHFFIAMVMLLALSENVSIGSLGQAHTFLPTTLCTTWVSSGVSFRFTRADWLVLPGRGVPAIGEAFRPQIKGTAYTMGEWLTKADNQTLLVFSAGSHTWERAMFTAHLKLVARRIQEHQILTPGFRAVYVSSVSGAPNCSSNWTDPGYITRSWDLINAMRPELIDQFARRGCAVLEAHVPAVQRPDMYPVGPNSPIKSRRGKIAQPQGRHSADCLHFCPHEQIYATWALTLANMVTRWGLLSHTRTHAAHKDHPLK